MPTLADSPDDTVVLDINTVIRTHLGAGLREYFGWPPAALPERLADLAVRVEATIAASGPADRDGFRDAMILAMPALRAFAFSLAGEASRADDLVQEALVKAWANRSRFVPGTNLNAWLFTILRNQFYTEARKRRREVEDAEGAHAATLTAPPEQEGVVILQALREKLARIPEAQRIALLMVGAEGYTYEEAAERLHCRVGTVKSRVSRARASLAEHLGFAQSDTRAAVP